MTIMGAVKRWLRVEEPMRKGASEVEAAFLAFMEEQSEMFGQFDTDGEPYVPATYTLSKVGTFSDGALWMVGDEWGCCYVHVVDGGGTAEVVLAKSENEMRTSDEVAAAFSDDFDYLADHTTDALTKWANGQVHKRQQYRVLRADVEKRYTLGVAYPTDEIDSHGDFTDAAELEEAAWEFMRSEVSKGDGVGTDHADGTDGAAVVVESYIYRGPDWLNDDGGLIAKAGDWLVGAVWGEQAWDRVKKGELTGWSIQGLAFRDESQETPDA